VTATLRLRQRAREDVEEAVLYYRDEAGERIALDLIDAVAAAFRAIAEYPGSGSPRYTHELDLPGLRYRQVGGFPYLVFYVEQAGQIDVWRVLHAHRDIPDWLQGSENDR
jgi:toxin ParE1/3/4